MVCSNYDSRIIYPADRGAGIRDRLIVLESLAKLAVSVCALLSMERPCKLLKRGHNRGMNVSCDWGWDRYARVHYKGMDVLSSTSPAATKEMPLALTGSNVVDSYDRAHACGHAESCTFVWTFPYFHTTAFDQLRTPARVELVLARHISDEADSVQQELAVKAYNTLHVRRRDTTAECDTSITRVIDYVNCSFTGRGPLLLYTDERSRDYLQPLMQGLRLLPSVAAVHHLDPLLTKRFPSDNYASFLAEMVLARRAVQSLELRRSNCEKCATAGKMVDEGFQFNLHVPSRLAPRHSGGKAKGQGSSYRRNRRLLETYSKRATTDLLEAELFQADQARFVSAHAPAGL